MVRGRPALGQNFLADPNLLEAIVREAELEAGDVVLEVGGGKGVLTERLAETARVVHVIEIDERLREGLQEIEARHEGVRLMMGDAMKADFRALDPAPSAMVANLPYAVATPVIMRSLEELAGVRRWTVMVQREIADRLRARPRTKAYGAPSVLAQLACRVEMLRAGLEEIAGRFEGVRLEMGDAMKVNFRTLDPAPSAMVANLPYAVATPVIMRSIEELPSVCRWTVMVQREIADRLRAVPRTKAYGAPSVLAQLACRVEMLRAVDRAVFRPPPRVDSALLRLERVAEWPGDAVARIVRAAFAHRRKALARSVATAGVASRERVLTALGAIGKGPTARAEELEPHEFVALAHELERADA